MDEGLCESLLTERLHAALGQRPDLHADTDSVDNGEQPLALTRHLAPLIERALRTAGSAQDRAELVANILEVLPGDDDQSGVLHQREPGRIDRLQALAKAKTLGVTALPRPATPLSDAALMTNAAHEPTLAHALARRNSPACPCPPVSCSLSPS